MRQRAADWFSRRRFPQARASVIAAGQQHPAIGTERQRRDQAVMFHTTSFPNSGLGTSSGARGSVPEPNGMIHANGGGQGSVGTESPRRYGALVLKGGADYLACLGIP